MAGGGLVGVGRDRVDRAVDEGSSVVLGDLPCVTTRDLAQELGPGDALEAASDPTDPHRAANRELREEHGGHGVVQRGETDGARGVEEEREVVAVRVGVADEHGEHHRADQHVEMCVRGWVSERRHSVATPTGTA